MFVPSFGLCSQAFFASSIASTLLRQLRVSNNSRCRATCLYPHGGIFLVVAAPTAAVYVMVCTHKIDDKSVAGGRAGEGNRAVPPPLTMAELFDEDRLEMMGCRLADYDPARLAAEGGEWLEEHPNPSLSPKAVRGSQ